MLYEMDKVCWLPAIFFSSTTVYFQKAVFNQDHFKLGPCDKVLTLSQKSPGFYVSAVKVF